MPHPDYGLSAEQLDDEYNLDGDGEHPDFPRADWRWAVAEDCTLLGYWAWVACKVDEGDTV